MTIRPFVFSAATVSLLAALIGVARFIPAPPASADPQALPPSRAQLKALYSEKCSACHNLPDPQADQRTRSQWQATVTKMLTRYHASDEITLPEAAQIVDYLATFAPAARGGGQSSRDPWATDPADVWANAPALSRVFNFENGLVQPGLAAAGSGAPGPTAVWHNVISPSPDGTFIKVAPAAAPDPSRFALLVDKADSGQDIDVRVRYQIIAGHLSPSVGIAFGLSDTANYSVLRFDAKTDALSVLKISPSAHTVLQSTTLLGPGAPASGSSNTAHGWHTLRLVVNHGSIHGWIDGMKRISTFDPAYAGGKVALWAQGDTVAAFDDWTTDFYSLNLPPPPRA